MPFDRQDDGRRWRLAQRHTGGTRDPRALATVERRYGRVYNISSGVHTLVAELVRLFGVDVVDACPTGADAVMDSGFKSGKNGIYQPCRVQQHLAWTPTDVATQVREYVEWAERHPSFFRM